MHKSLVKTIPQDLFYVQPLMLCEVLVLLMILVPNAYIVFIVLYNIDAIVSAQTSRTK